MKEYRNKLSELRLAVENDIAAEMRKIGAGDIIVSESGLNVLTEEDGTMNVEKITLVEVDVIPSFEIELTLEDNSTVLVNDCNLDDMISVYETVCMVSIS